MYRAFKQNEYGKDFVVGDIHGAFTKLTAALYALKFDSNNDRLFSVGDLVDRGPESHLAIDWIAKPWFHAVRGNHEDMAIGCIEGVVKPSDLMRNGGGWFLALPLDERRRITDHLKTLPYAIEVETATGLVGIIHAACPYDSWNRLRMALTDAEVQAPDRVLSEMTWSRTKIMMRDEESIADIDRIFVGHTPNREPVTLGNVHYIDTAACWDTGKFTIVEL